jgi:hypothetical protein
MLVWGALLGVVLGPFFLLAIFHNWSRYHRRPRKNLHKHTTILTRLVCSIYILIRHERSTCELAHAYTQTDGKVGKQAATDPQDRRSSSRGGITPRILGRCSPRPARRREALAAGQSDAPGRDPEERTPKTEAGTIAKTGIRSDALPGH